MVPTFTNCVFLRQSMHETDSGLRIFGTDFFWPILPGENNPYFDQIPPGTDIIVAHGPAKDHVDGGHGCTSLLSHIKRVKPRLVVCGHIHHAHGVVQGDGELSNTTFVNAAICKGEGYTVGFEPVVVHLPPKHQES
eukprot:TRINITY_DN23598_c0_g1_i1.p1 TRINITY_DN23598_c0_g1~~TRINITY_DN23598_c0_g1_i1.p1  ORF type:complete len:136 (+),score=21.04 TRINITY_DN23598_c0_g1_i1:219-626(+)